MLASPLALPSAAPFSPRRPQIPQFPRSPHIRIGALTYLARRSLFSPPTSALFLRSRTRMSQGSNSPAIGQAAAGGTRRRQYQFGRTHVIRPKGTHLATIVWLHGLGDNGASVAQYIETIPLPNVKWICPTAPTRPVAVFAGFPATAWFDVDRLDEDAPPDMDGMDDAAAHVATLLSAEPADIKLGICGFSMGAATALYSATCFAHGKYAGGNPYPINLSAVVGLSGWLPDSRNFAKRISSTQEAAARAASLPLMLCHGKEDEVVLYKFGEKSANVMLSNGFSKLTFKSYDGVGHHLAPQEIRDFTSWLTSMLGL